MDFNSHAHVERDIQYLKSAKSFMHFNSHAHVERDVNNKSAERGNKISTHTLTWSVTALNGNYGGYPNISTHTLTWSVTRSSKMRKGGLNISTHTLTWSVTFSSASSVSFISFQLTRSRGA